MKKSFRIAGTALIGILLLAAQPLIAQHPISPRAVERLNREVRHKLVMLPFYSVFDNFEYQVDGYDVILSGQVTRPTLKSDAVAVVKRIEGVEKVIDNIEVLPLSPSDDEIRVVVYSTLFSQNSPLMRYGLGADPSIHIIVKNGHVTLVGVVANEGDKTIAGLRTRSIPGLFSVTNNLRTESS